MENVSVNENENVSNVEVENVVLEKTPKYGNRKKPNRIANVQDVQKWYRRHCGDFIQYIHLFQMHEVTGKALLRITDNSLERMGILDKDDRDAILREILKQKLKTDIMEIRDIELMNDCTL